jgi:hypothetical protein
MPSPAFAAPDTMAMAIAPIRVFFNMSCLPLVSSLTQVTIDPWELFKARKGTQSATRGGAAEKDDGEL